MNMGLIDPMMSRDTLTIQSSHKDGHKRGRCCLPKCDLTETKGKNLLIHTEINTTLK